MEKTAAELYPVGTSVKVVALTSNTHDHVQVGHIGIVSLHFGDGDVYLTRDGDDDNYDGDNQMGYFAATHLVAADVGFQIGDLVKCIHDRSYSSVKMGRTYQVSDIDSSTGDIEFEEISSAGCVYDPKHFILVTRVTEAVVEDPKSNSLIGRLYWPTDNGYARCLTDPEYEYLLGRTSIPGREAAEQTTILLEPFDALVSYTSPVIGGKKVEETVKMVIVQCLRGHYHQVLFDERGLEAPS